MGNNMDKPSAPAVTLARPAEGFDGALRQLLIIDEADCGALSQILPDALVGLESDFLARHLDQDDLHRLAHESPMSPLYMEIPHA